MFPFAVWVHASRAEFALDDQDRELKAPEIATSGEPQTL
jgi:hypothetical protein